MNCIGGQLNKRFRDEITAAFDGKSRMIDSET